MGLHPKKQTRRLLQALSEARRRHRNLRHIARDRDVPRPPPVAPVWPLPRRPGGPSDEEIRAAFARHDAWHYAFQFEGDLGFSSSHRVPLPARGPRRPLQRFRHLMPWLVQAVGGSLAGKRVLDIACNSGFWSIQCGLLGAREVVGFDARPELVEQAKLIRSIVGLEHVDFRVLDFWAMCPEALGGPFDVVLNLGILYHLPNPIEALARTRAMAREWILLDTALYVAKAAVLRVEWEEPLDIHYAAAPGVIMRPSRRSIPLLLRHVGLHDWTEIPLCTPDMPPDYLTDRRASWLIRVPGEAPAWASPSCAR
jgi:SAM-dependent methyltransferase